MLTGRNACWQVCPWNKFEWGDVEGSPLFGAVTADVAAPRLEELLVLDDAAFKRRFAGTAVSRPETRTSTTSNPPGAA